MAGELLHHLTRHIMTRADGYIRKAFNSIDGMTAWSGIKNDPENAKKAFLNHYGRISRSGGKVPARPFITNAVEDTGPGEKRKVVRGPKMAMRRAVMYHIQDSVIGGFKGSFDDNKEPVYKKPKTGSSEWYFKTERVDNTRVFGSHTSPAAVMMALAKQMNQNQKESMVRTEKNAESTLRKKKGRSDKPLIDYGDMRRAVRYGLE